MIKIIQKKTLGKSRYPSMERAGKRRQSIRRKSDESADGEQLITFSLADGRGNTTTPQSSSEGKK